MIKNTKVKFENFGLRLHNSHALSVMTSLFAIAFFMSFVGYSTIAAEPTNLSLIKPLLRQSTIAVAKVEAKNVELAKLLGNLPQAIQENATSLIAAIGNEDLFLVIDMPTSDNLPTTRVVIRRGSQDVASKLQEAFARFNITETETYNTWLVFDVNGINKRTIVDEMAASDFKNMETVFKSVTSFPVQVAIVPPSYLIATVRDLVPNLPTQLGGGESRILIDGFQTGSIGFDPKSMKVNIQIQSNSGESAKQLAAYWPTMISGLIKSVGKNTTAGAVADLFNSSKIETTGSVVEIKLDANASEFKSLASRLSNAMSGPLSDSQKSEQFKNLGLAVHNFESNYKTFPPVKGRDEKGPAKLSWRVQLLPYLDQLDLYRQFRLNESWDSPHNIKLLEKMPAIYKSSSSNSVASSGIKPGYTTYLAPVGADTIFGGDKPVRFQDIDDGTSNTIMFVEVKPERAVPWTAPEDYKFDEAKPADGLAIGDDGKFLAALSDGSALRIPGNLAPRMILNLFQKNDGNAIQW